MTDVMIDARDLTKHYGAVTALKNATFQVHRGEVVGFLGPNGAGKTTAMKILTCFIAPSEGTARVAGADIFEDPIAVREAIGYLPENTPLYTEMLVLEYLEFAGKMRGLRGAGLQARLRRVVEETSLGDVIGKSISELSKGFRQRVGLAQALIHEPPVLILDEPMSGLDPNQAAEIRELIREIGRERTVILSTHNLSEVRVTCGRVLIISQGELVADDTPEELAARGGKPRFVATLRQNGHSASEIRGGRRGDPRARAEGRPGPARGHLSGGGVRESRTPRPRATRRESRRHLSTAHDRRGGVIMNHILTIGGRQFRSYFNGPVAYIVICIVMLALGFFFWNTFFLYGRASAREMFRWLSLILVFALPALTMGLLAEEKRTGTIELLITMPVTDAQVILGKFIGVLGLYAVILVLTVAYPISVSTLGNLDWGPVWSGYLGLLLQGSAVLAIGLMASSWTDNQLIALFVALTLSVFFWVLDKFLALLPTNAASALEWLSFDYHFQSMARGVVDLRDVLFFFSVTIFALALAFRALESRRWT